MNQYYQRQGWTKTSRLYLLLKDSSQWWAMVVMSAATGEYYSAALAGSPFLTANEAAQVIEREITRQRKRRQRKGLRLLEGDRGEFENLKAQIVIKDFCDS